MTKEKLKQRNIVTTEAETGINYIRITIILVVILAVFYLITYLVTKKEDTTTQEPTIQYTEVLAGNILSLSDKEYYVLVAMEDDKYIDLYGAYLMSYASKETALPYYTVDMSKGFNKSYISDNLNLNVTDVSELKFNSTVLLKVTGGKITAHYDNNEAITTFLKSIVK